MKARGGHPTLTVFRTKDLVDHTAGSRSPSSICLVRTILDLMAEIPDLDGAFVVRTYEPSDLREQLARDARRGLSGPKKRLPPKYFYDARGSELFERITRLPEYYLTRAETAILRERSAAIMARARPDEIVEIGSGSSIKTPLLLEAMRSTTLGNRYVPIDVSEEAVRRATRTLSQTYDWIEVTGVIGDYEHPFSEIPRRGRRLVAFLGSTIGNLELAERVPFLRRIAALLLDSDRFLLGIDLVKDVAKLEAAYNDSAGVTAEFNLNVIQVLNRELEGDLALEAFEHLAIYDRDQARIEMRLKAKRPLKARLHAIDMELSFEQGEELLTEISCKFTRESVVGTLQAAGLWMERWFTDSEASFALALVRKAGTGIGRPAPQFGRPPGGTRERGLH